MGEIRNCLKTFQLLPLTSVNGEVKGNYMALAELCRRIFGLKPPILSTIPLTEVNGNELTSFVQIKFR